MLDPTIQISISIWNALAVLMLPNRVLHWECPHNFRLNSWGSYTGTKPLPSSHSKRHPWHGPNLSRCALGYRLDSGQDVNRDDQPRKLNTGTRPRHLMANIPRNASNKAFHRNGNGMADRQAERHPRITLQATSKNLGKNIPATPKADEVSGGQQRVAAP